MLTDDDNNKLIMAQGLGPAPGGGGSGRFTTYFPRVYQRALVDKLRNMQNSQRRWRWMSIVDDKKHATPWEQARKVTVTLHEKTGRCVCTPHNTPLGPLGMHKYMKQDALPQWAKDKIMKLQMMEPYHPFIPGLGRRSDRDEYTLLTPYTYLPHKARSRRARE